MELSESNITEFVLVSHAELYLNSLLTASYKILKRFVIISEFFESILSELGEVKLSVYGN